MFMAVVGGGIVAIFRSIGETKVPLTVLASSGVLNVLLIGIAVLVFRPSRRLTGQSQNASSPSAA